MKFTASPYFFLVFLLVLGGCCIPVTLLTRSYTDAELKSIISATGSGSKITVDNLCTTLAGSICDEQVEEAVLKIRANTGEVYNYGKHSFISTIKLELIKEERGSSPVVVETIVLEIDQANPEIVYQRDITSWYAATTYWEAWIEIVNYSNSSTIGENFQFEVTVDKTLSPSPVNITDATRTLISSYAHSDPTENTMKFSWDSPCDFTLYEFQLLKLYNTDESYAKDEACHATLDWSNATSILTSETEIALSIGEGSGFYAWRVRPIGNRYSGGFANDHNWGVWNVERTELTFDKSAGDSYEDDFFYHRSIGDEENWIFTRTFTEHARIAEQVTFYNGLLFEKQTQRRLFTDSLNFINHSFYDYAGRASLKALGVPLDFNSFEYQKEMLTRNGILFGPLHFDEDENYDSSWAATGGLIHKYWSDDNPDLTIPSADSFPYSRTIFYPDGTNKPKELGNVGNIHRIGENRTIKTYFTSASESELVSMFGDEAPDERDVFKTIVIDPNKTKTVTYTDKSGQTLATHLLLNGDNLVDTLPSGNDAIKTTVTEVKYNERLDDYTIKSKQNFVWTDEIDVTIDYVITPRDIEAECGEYCSSCDYEIEIFATSIDTGGRIVLDHHTIPAGSCSGKDSWSYHETKTFNGEWEIGRTITVNNKNSSTGNTNLQDHLSAVNDHFESNTANKLESLFDHLAVYDLEAFYNEIKVIDPRFTEDSTYITFNAGCCEFQIPKVDCNENCPGSGEEFEKLLIDTWGPGGKEFIAEDGGVYNYGCSIYEYFFEPLELTGRESKYPPPAIEEYYGEFKGIDYSSFSGYFSVQFAVESCNSQINEVIEWNTSYLGVGKSLTEWIADELQDKLFAAGIREYIAYPVEGTIRVIPDYSADDDGAFISPNATLSLSISGSGFAYSSFTNIKLRTSGDPFPAGNGAFAQLIDNMLADGYDTCELWYCWQGLVSSFDILAYEDGDPTKNRKDFDLLEAFLQCTGKQYEGFCTNPYYEVKTGGGYLDNAHKYFYYDDGSATSSCTYDTKWPPDTRDGDLYSDYSYSLGCDFIDWSLLTGTSSATDTRKNWEAFYTCLTYGTDAASEIVSEATGIGECTDITSVAEAEECLVAVITSIKDTCLSYCEQRLDGFYLEVLSYYEAHGDTVDSCIALCKAYTMVDSCKKNCEFEITDFLDLSSTDPAAVLDEDAVCEIVEGLITSLTYEWEYSEPLESIEEYSYWTEVTDYTVPNTDNYNYSNDDLKWEPLIAYESEFDCPNDSFGLYYNYLFSDLRCYADSLNSKFAGYGSTHTTVDASTYWNIFKSVLNKDDYNNLLSCNSSPYYAPDPLWSLPYTSYYFYIDEPCSLMVAIVDTIITDGVMRVDTTTELLCDHFDCLMSCPVCIKTVPPEFTALDTLTVESCEKESAEYLATILQRQIEDCRDSILLDFESNYLSTCGDPANIDDTLTVSYSEARYHYTLYFYDRAGNLVSTVPPKGADVDVNFTRLIHPDHTFKTIYNYNSLGQLIQSESPDGGKTTYIYNDIGLLRFFRNAKQLNSGKYSYIKYDELGRIIETGENNYPSAGLEDYFNDLGYPSATGTERTFTVYSNAASVTYLDGTAQRFLRNNVSYMYNDDGVYTYYSYDPHGNVEWMIQDIPGLGKNYIKYEYDLISRLVTEVKYNEGLPDQFYHRYNYDADKRIKEVQTSGDHVIWDTDARYEYYAYGPLKRMTLGEDYVQGLDYIYTIQGWLKSINHCSLDYGKDPGQDGDAGGPNSMVAKDVHAVTLSYYENDFNRQYSGVSSPFNITDPYTLKVTDPLYDGNISIQETSNALSGSAIRYGNQATAFNYQYDELNRLLQSTFSYYSGGWVENEEYQSGYSYDPNGNILSLDRNGIDDSRGLDMDRLTYHYPASPVYTNQLEYVDDAGNTNYDEDLRDQAPGNYDYDELGNLIKDEAEGIDKIEWNLSGKVKRIIKADGSELRFGYDAMGNRAWKTFTASGSSDSTTYYVRNTNGQPLSIFSNYKGPDVKTPVEWLIYGQQRIGSRYDTIEKEPPIAIPVSGYALYKRYLGQKSYELTNHLGNVQSTISDIKLSALDASSVPVDFAAEITSYQGYYPFGSELPDNKWSSSSIRFGFNGIEKLSNSIMPSTYDFGDRYYSSKNARFLSTDELAAQFSSESPYSGLGNNPIKMIDPDGRAYTSYFNLKITALILASENSILINEFIKDGALNTDAFEGYNAGHVETQSQLASGESEKLAIEYARTNQKDGREIETKYRMYKPSLLVDIGNGIKVPIEEFTARDLVKRGILPQSALESPRVEGWTRTQLNENMRPHSSALSKNVSRMSATVLLYAWWYDDISTTDVIIGATPGGDAVRTWWNGGSTADVAESLVVDVATENPIGAAAATIPYASQKIGDAVERKLIEGGVPTGQSRVDRIESQIDE